MIGLDRLNRFNGLYRLNGLDRLASSYRRSNAVAFRALVALAGLRLLLQPAAAAQTEAPKPPRIEFVDIAAKAGLTIKTESGGEKSKKYIIETTSSGAGFFDYDGDGWPDIFLVNGTTLEPRAVSPPATSQLYHNNHDWTLTNVTKRDGVGLTGWR